MASRISMPREAGTRPSGDRGPDLWHHGEVYDPFLKKWMSKDDYVKVTKNPNFLTPRYSPIDDIRSGIDRFGDILEDFRDMTKEDRERYEKERRRVSEQERKQIEADRAYWNRMRDQAYGDWMRDRGSILDFWTGTRDRESDFLQGLKRQQMGLADELRTAPSTVMEQARMMQDQAMSQSVALAGAMGGGVSGNYANLENMARTAQGDLLTKTSALRAQEYANRINQRSGILGQAGTTSGMISGLAAGDAELRSGLAAQNYNVLTGLPQQNVNIGTNLYNRSRGLLGDITVGASMGRAGMGQYISGLGQMQGMRTSLLNSQIALNQEQRAQEQARRAQEQYEQSQTDRLWQQIIGGLTTAGSIIAAPFTGGTSLVALPAGIGMLGGSGGGGNIPPQSFAGMFSSQPRPDYGAPNPDNWDFRDVGGENIGSSFNSLHVRSGTNMPIGGTGSSGFNFRGVNNFGGFA